MQNKKSLNHLAIIMDGNGRWAINQELPRTAGHAAGEHSLSRTIDWAIKNKLEWLTVYAFSTENWLRSGEEVDFLMFFAGTWSASAVSVYSYPLGGGRVSV